MPAWWRRKPLLCLALAALTAVVIAERAGWIRSPAARQIASRPRRYGDCRVARVIDGDTLDVDVPVGRQATTRVRLVGVDTPEMPDRDRAGMHFAGEATAFARDAVEGRRVRLELLPTGPTTDKYGRLLAYVVRIDDDRMLNAMLVEGGFGYADWRFAHPRDREFRRLERTARRKRVGLWAAATRTDWPDWRRRMADGRD